jgi:hypothetical protein
MDPSFEARESTLTLGKDLEQGSSHSSGSHDKLIKLVLMSNYLGHPGQTKAPLSPGEIDSCPARIFLPGQSKMETPSNLRSLI